MATAKSDSFKEKNLTLLCSDHVSPNFPCILFLRNKNLEEQWLHLCPHNWSESCNLKLYFEYYIYYSKIAIRNLIALLNILWIYLSYDAGIAEQCEQILTGLY